MIKIKWDDLSRLGRSRVLQTSYLWLFIVPVAAKALSLVSDPLVLSGLSEDLVIDLTLPFSWKLFYLSAVLVAVASVIYTVRCPEIIRRFGTFSEFHSEGRRVDYLRRYFESMDCDLKEEDEVIEFYKFGEDLNKPDAEEELPKYFWRIHELENVRFPLDRIACLGLYCTGLGLIGVVLLQNFIFVVEQIF